MKLSSYRTCPPSNSASFNPWLRNPLAVFESLFGPAISQPSNPSLAVDLFEDGDHFYALFEVPGVKKEDAKIEFNNNVLTVTVEKRRQIGDQETRTQLTRSLRVPESFRADGITAKLENGILTVTLPKPEERKPRTIELN
ncbi:MAG: Hsp20/alpha crystallin family protein [Verrucomicrobiales bacterium]|nr:Hsp20/alpha crystallin family protein [Verrucomicrobiales bacterium]